MNSRDPPSKILLLIITQLPPSFPLTNDYLHSIFSKYGDIKKILIFQRGKANKCFVEYFSVENAQAARRDQFGKQIAYCGGKMQIHFSRLKNLDLEVVDQSRGTDYSCTTYGSSRDDFYQKEVQNQGNSSFIQHSKTDDPNLLSNQFMQLDFREILNAGSNEEPDKQNEQIFQMKSVDQNMKQQMEKFLDDDYESEVYRKQKLMNQNQQIKQSSLMPQQFLPQQPTLQQFQYQQPQQNLLFQQLLQAQQQPQQYSQNVMDPIYFQGMNPIQQQLYLQQIQQQQLQIYQNMYLQQLMQQSQIPIKVQEPEIKKPVQKKYQHTNDEIDNLLNDDAEDDDSLTKSRQSKQSDQLEKNSTQKLNGWRNQKDEQDQLSLSSLGSSKNLKPKIKVKSQIIQIFWKDQKNQEIHSILQQKPSKAIQIQGLLEGVTSQMIFNLFSNFGNIDTILIIKKQGGGGGIFISFQSIEFATIAKELLNNLSIKEQQMKIQFYMNEILTPNSPNDDFLVIPPSAHKIYPQLILCINSPSEKVIIQSKKFIPINDLRELFSNQNFEIVDLKSLEIDLPLVQYLLTLKDISKALELVAVFAEYEYKESKLTITFAKKNI